MSPLEICCIIVFRFTKVDLSIRMIVDDTDRTMVSNLIVFNVLPVRTLFGDSYEISKLGLVTSVFGTFWMAMQQASIRHGEQSLN